MMLLPTSLSELDRMPSSSAVKKERTSLHAPFLSINSTAQSEKRCIAYQLYTKKAPQTDATDELYFIRLKCFLLNSCQPALFFQHHFINDISFQIFDNKLQVIAICFSYQNRIIRVDYDRKAHVIIRLAVDVFMQMST